MTTEDTERRIGLAWRQAGQPSPSVSEASQSAPGPAHMTDQTLLGACTEILSAQAADEAATLLAEALLDLTHAEVGLRVRVEQTPFGPDVDLDIHARREVPEDTWRQESTRIEHPFTRYYRATGSFAPVSLDQVVRAGFGHTADELARRKRLGTSPHQVSLPISGTAAAFEGWAFISATPYADEEVERLGRLQRLIIGLDRHVQTMRANRGFVMPIPSTARDPLTHRERAVLVLTRAGLTAGAIGTRLGVSPRTVHKHQENLYRKLGATDRLSAVLAAQRLGLLPES